jgi:hypothetical protein
LTFVVILSQLFSGRFKIHEISQSRQTTSGFEMTDSFYTLLVLTTNFSDGLSINPTTKP